MHCKIYKRGNNFIYLKLPRVVELSSLLNNLITENFSLKLSEKLARAKVNQWKVIFDHKLIQFHKPQTKKWKISTSKINEYF